MYSPIITVEQVEDLSRLHAPDHAVLAIARGIARMSRERPDPSMSDPCPLYVDMLTFTPEKLLQFVARIVETQRTVIKARAEQTEFDQAVYATLDGR